MRTDDNPVAVAPQTHPQHHRTPLLAGSYERPIPATRGPKAPVHELNAPLMSPCIQNRTSGRKYKIRTPDAIQSGVEIPASVAQPTQGSNVDFLCCIG